MKRPTDDMADWRLQQENKTKPFPYVFPQMPPRFRRCRRFIQTLFLVEWGSYFIIIFVGLMAVLVMLIRGKAGFPESQAILFTALALVIFLPLGFLCRWLRHTPKFFWHCPCCGQPFPYYAPPLLRGLDELKEADCLYSMKFLRIKYVKTKVCPLIIPSLCPKCRCKFFEMTKEQ